MIERDVIMKKWKRVILNGEKTNFIISDEADIINMNTFRETRKFLSDGFIKAKVYTDIKKTKSENVAYIMLETFYGKRKTKDNILFFFDEDKTNVSLENITYVTIDQYFQICKIKLFEKDGEDYKLKDGNKEGEIWKQYNTTRYMVSNYGRVLNINTGLFLTPTFPKSKDLYPFLTIRVNGKSKRVDMHKLVASLFVKNDNPNEKTIVHHKNNNKHDFYYKNLEWTTQSQNAIYAYESGMSSQIGETSTSSKITEETARKICKMLSDGYRICEIASTLGVSRNIIRHIKDKTTWKRISDEYDFSNLYSKNLNINDIKLILSLLETHTISEISKITGFGTTTISRIKSIYSNPREKNNNFKNSKRTESIILKLYNDGVSLDQIEEFSGIRKTSILDILLHHDLL